MKIYRLAQTEEEYMLENGMLYDIDGEDVFSFKELLKYNVPLFKTPSEANSFLEQLEQSTGKIFGRVPNRNFMKELRYKDTRKEKQQAEQEWLLERDERWKRGKF
jgi:hypothetical protein